MDNFKIDTEAVELEMNRAPPSEEESDSEGEEE